MKYKKTQQVQNLMLRLNLQSKSKDVKECFLLKLNLELDETLTMSKCSTI